MQDKHGERWSSEDQWKLIEMYAKGASYTKISNALGRSVRACYGRVHSIKNSFRLLSEQLDLKILEELEHEKIS